MVVLPSLKMGGAERAITALLASVDQTRAEWHLVLIHPRADEAYTVPKGVIVHQLQHARLLTALPTLLIKVHRYRPTTVISTLTHLNITLCGVRIFFPKSTRLICREASLLRTNSEQEKVPKLFRSLVRCCYPLADHIVCLSNQMKRELASHATFSKDQLQVIPNGLALEMNGENEDRQRSHTSETESPFTTSLITESPFAQQGSGPHIIVVGRLDPNKQGDVAIKAFASWSVSYPTAQLWFLGTGTCAETWSQLTHDLNLSDVVHFTGQQDDLIPWYQHADLMLMTSKQEGLPNVLIEAIALSCPVQVLQHEGGGLEILKQVGLEERWVTQLDEPLFDKSQCSSAAQACRITYSIEYMTSAWERLIFTEHDET
jgi:glycosyltransferase involved in cell wall biosynthesis